jgi:molecular chaperone DnaK (HSP70)
MMEHNFIGIDLGSNTAIVSHLNRNVNQVVLDGTGDRETPVCVSYSEQERLFGLKANMRLKSRPLSTVLCPQRFLTEDLRQLEIESSFNPAKFENQEFHLEGNNLDLSIEPKQVTTGFFNYLQGMTNNIPNNTLTLSTISTPNHTSYKVKK